MESWWAKREAQIDVFAQGSWQALLRPRIRCAGEGATFFHRECRRQSADGAQPELASLIQLEELHSARQALERAPVAPGTWHQLRESPNLCRNQQHRDNLFSKLCWLPCLTLRCLWASSSVHRTSGHPKRGRCGFRDSATPPWIIAVDIQIATQWKLCGRWDFSGSATPPWISAGIWILYQRMRL